MKMSIRFMSRLRTFTVASRLRHPAPWAARRDSLRAGSPTEGEERMSRRATLGTAAVLCVVALAAGGATARSVDGGGGGAPTTTPVKHLVVIFQENVSFDHYFATYPDAANTDGTPFTSRTDTPSVNGLNEPLNDPNNPNAAQPFRLTDD